MQPPSLGRIVHYVDEITSTSQAALIVATVREVPALIKVGDDAVNLHVYGHRGGYFLVSGAREGTSAGQWHWPPRVEPAAPVPSAAPPPQVLTGTPDAATGPL